MDRTHAELIFFHNLQPIPVLSLATQLHVNSSDIRFLSDHPIFSNPHLKSVWIEKHPDPSSHYAPQSFLLLSRRPARGLDTTMQKFMQSGEVPGALSIFKMDNIHKLWNQHLTHTLGITTDC